MLTYTVRFKKVSVHPNELANLTVTQYKGTQFINGNITILPNIVTDKVSITVINQTTLVLTYQCHSV